MVIPFAVLSQNGIEAEFLLLDYSFGHIFRMRPTNLRPVALGSPNRHGCPLLEY